MIDLAHCTTVKSADLKSKKRHSFEISTPEVTYLLYADTEQEKDDWIGRVGKAIVRCSSTYYSQGGNGANKNGPQGVYQQQQQQQSGQSHPMINPYRRNHPHAAGYPEYDESDDDIYYEDPNNPLPYFND